MRVISQESMMHGSNSVFYHWEPYEIPVSGLSMSEVQDVVERFNKDAPISGPMRSSLSQLAANAVQSIVELDPKTAVGAPETPGKRRGNYRSLNEPLAEVAVLADITMPQYWDVLDDVFGAPKYGRTSHFINRRSR